MRVQVVGAHLQNGKLRKLLPIYQEGAVDEDLLQEGLRNIRDDLQREGYFDSQADYSSTEDTAKNERVITYSVTRGAKHRLLNITFCGKQIFQQTRCCRAGCNCRPNHMRCAENSASGW